MRRTPQYVAFGDDVKRSTNFGLLSQFSERSFFAPVSEDRISYVRLEREVDITSFLLPRRIRTLGKLSYGPKIRRPLKAHGRFAGSNEKHHIYMSASCK